MENLLIILAIIAAIFLMVTLLNLKYRFEKVNEINVLIYLFLLLPFLGMQKYGGEMSTSVFLRGIVYLIILLFAFYVKRYVAILKRDITYFMKLSLPFLLFICYNFITAFYIPDYWMWVLFKNGELLFNIFISFIVFLIISKKNNSLDIVSIFYKFNVLLLVLIIIEALIFPSKALLPDRTPWGFRLSLAWPIATSGTVTIIGVMVFLLTINKDKNKYWDYVLIFISIVIIILGGTRNKIVGLIAGILSLFLISKKTRKYILLSSVIILPFVLLFGPKDLWNMIYEAIFLRGSEISLQTFSGRIPTWEAVEPLFWERPIWGNGYYAASRFLVPIYAPWRTESVTLEGMWPNILIGSGLIGAILMMVFIVLFTFRIFQVLKFVHARSPQFQIVRVIILIWIVIVIGSFSTDSFCFQSFESVSLMIIMALLTNLNKEVSLNLDNKTV